MDRKLKGREEGGSSMGSEGGMYGGGRGKEGVMGSELRVERKGEG